MRENQVGPRRVERTSAVTFVSRSHAAYTYRESSGSAVIVSLSRPASASSSRASVTGSLQVRPPSAERHTSTAFTVWPPELSNARLLW